MTGSIIDHNAGRQSVDLKHVLAAFDRDDREALRVAAGVYPRSAVHLPHSDLVASGRMSGVGGFVPSDWDGSVVKL